MINGARKHIMLNFRDSGGCVAKVVDLSPSHACEVLGVPDINPYSPVKSEWKFAKGNDKYIHSNLKFHVIQLWRIQNLKCVEKEYGLDNLCIFM